MKTNIKLLLKMTVLPFIIAIGLIVLRNTIVPTIVSIEETEYGTQLNFDDGTGYFIEK